MNIIEIDKTETFYHSLSTINYNTAKLDENLAVTIQNSYTWKDLAAFYIDFKNLLQNTSTFSQTYSALFFNTATLVESNSATWLKPINIFYPTLFPAEIPVDEIKKVIESWVEIRYPIFSDYISSTFTPPTYEDLSPKSINISYITPQQQFPKYTQGQKLIVNLHRWSYGSTVLESRYLSDKTICSTSDRTICAHCIERYYGYVHCSNGDFNCSGRSTSCSQCKTISCSYKTPPYVSRAIISPPPITSNSPQTLSNQIKSSIVSGVKEFFINKLTIFKDIRWPSLSTTLTPVLDSSNRNVYSQITANIEMAFVDRNESSNIISMLFEVENCEWVFRRYL